MTQESASREVLIRVTVENDHAQNAAALRDLGKASDEIQKGVKEAGEAAGRAIDKTADEAKKKLEKLNDEYERQRGVVGASNMAIAEGGKQAAEGVMTLARGVALLSASNQESAEKAAKIVLQMQGMIDTGKGAMEAVLGITKAYKGYKSALEAAAASKIALDAAQGFSGSVGGKVGGGAAAGVAGGVASGAAGGAMAGGGAGAGIAGVASVVAIPAAIAVGITAAIFGGLALFSESWREFFADGWGGFWKEGELAKEEAQKAAGRQYEEGAVTSLMRKEAALYQVKLQYGDVSAQEQRSHAAGAVSSAYSDDMAGEKGMHTARSIANQQEIASLSRLKQLEHERLQTVQSRIQEQLAGAKEELATARQSLDVEKSKADAILNQRLSAKERFGQLDTYEQEKLKEIQRRAQAGGDLSREDRASLRGIGLDSTTATARAGDLAAADDAGWGGVFGADERQREAQHRQNAVQAQVKITGLEKIEVELTAKTEQIGRKIADELGPVFAELIRKLEEAASREVENQHGQVRANRSPAYGEG